MSGAVPQTLLDQGYESIEWKGQQAFAKPGQWLAQLGDFSGSARKQLNAANSLLGASGTDLKADRHLGQDGLVLLKGPKTFDFAKVQGTLKKLKNFVSVEPDFALWSTATVSNDPYSSSLWGLNNTGQTGGTADADIDAPEAWDLARGNGTVVVGVIDSGIDYTHPDLQGNVWVNPGETAGNGLDDDGNGYTDDIYGYDFYNNDANPMDDNGHGTHVAGTIAAMGNNGTGVVGVNWNAKVMALKFLGADGSGSTSAAIAAVNYATKMKSQYGVNVRVTNNSWGGGGYSSTLFDAIKRSGEAGQLFVASAGNGGSDNVGDNNDVTAHYPDGYNLPNVISVAATNHNDVLGSFSNYGVSSVDLAAPGVSIRSTTPGGGYGYSSGTSMAAPHVSGVVALAWSYASGASATDVRSAVLNGVDAKSSLSGKVATGGRLNAFKTLQLIGASTTAPTAPSGLSATAVSSSQIDLAWTDNSSNETGFRVYRSTDGVNFAEIATLGAGTTRYNSTGLTAGTTYSYYVLAFNAVGSSSPSNVTSATTAAAQPTAPNAPSNLGATALSKTSVRLNWQDNSGNESGFRIERSTDGRRWSLVTNVGAGITTYTNSGLKRNTTYYYRVAAYNNVRTSPFSNTATTKTLAAGSLLSFASSNGLRSGMTSGEADEENSLDSLLA